MGLTPRRKRGINELLAEGISLSQIQEAFLRAEQSDFLTGRVEGAEWNRFDFDWLIQPSIIISLLEGKYDNVAVQKQRRIAQNQLMIDKMNEKFTHTEPLTEEQIKKFPSFLKDAMKRHKLLVNHGEEPEASS